MNLIYYISYIQYNTCTNHNVTGKPIILQEKHPFQFEIIDNRLNFGKDNSESLNSRYKKRELQYDEEKMVNPNVICPKESKK